LKIFLLKVCVHCHNGIMMGVRL